MKKVKFAMQKEILFEKKITVKSKKLERVYKSLNEVNELIEGNDLLNAKKSYAKAREIYIILEYEERKEVYKELMKIYNRLKNKYLS